MTGGKWQGPPSMTGLNNTRSSLLRRRLDFLEQRLDGLVHRLAAHALVADRALGVEDVDRRVIPDVQLLADRTVLAVEPVRPGHLFLLQELLERLLLGVAADAHQ